MIATPSEPLTILTFASSNYLHWLAHLHRNVEQLQLRDASLLACTADDASLAAAHSKGLATIDVWDTAGCGLCSLLKINATEPADHSADTRFPVQQRLQKSSNQLSPAQPSSQETL